MHWKFGCLALCAASINAAEFDPDLLKDMRKLETKSDGFELATSINLPFSFAHSQSRLGVTSGNYVDIAGKASSALTYQRGFHEADLVLLLAEGFSTAPSNDGFWDKSMDLLRLETRYLHHTLSWLSLFAHARADTSIFKGYVRHDSEKAYEIRDQDDNVRETERLKRLKLTDSFSPIFVQENFGVVAGLFSRDYLNIEAKTALSLRQTFAQGQLVLVKEDKDQVVVRDLRTFYQAGYLLGTAFNWQLWEDRIGYRAGIDITYPFWQTPTGKKNFVDSLIVEAAAGLSLKLSSWSSLKYEYTAVRMPEILQDFQQYHLVNLNIAFDWLYTFGG